MTGPATAKTALRLLAGLGLVVLALAGFMVWHNPADQGGYIVATMAIVQLVISKVGEIVRLAFGKPPEDEQ